MTDQRRPGTRNPRFGPGGPGPSPHARDISVTRNHDVIRRWAEQRGARPATVPGSEYDGRLGVLRFDFPGYGGAVLRRVDWDEWFATFDARKLRFWYQEPGADRPPSNFNRLEPPR
ncbi:hypothetical protein ABZ511_08010 [Nocardia gamkensis]|uniref:hypothetical protein n=1 Tax=Nocardia TaxID=1817 RepID=UPI0033C0E33E